MGRKVRESCSVGWRGKTRVGEGADDMRWCKAIRDRSERERESDMQCREALKDRSERERE